MNVCQNIEELDYILENYDYDETLTHLLNKEISQKQRMLISPNRHLHERCTNFFITNGPKEED